ncbi:MAG: aminotransferase class I/II-fold pyridoxal phosphate-dependent enzyme [bacterium]
MDQSEAPYFNAIIDYIQQKPLRFHYPGHKGRLSLWDLTELPQTDNLFFPTGPLLKAQELAALAFGSDHTYFLTNGTTQGIQSAFLTAFKKGDKIILSRFSHRSIIEGVILSGTEPIFIDEDIDEWGIYKNIQIAELKDISGAKGLVITNPNYFGLVSELKDIVEWAHKKRLVVIVDEAHGAHLHFNKELPISGVDAKADITIQSMHKMGISLTPGALLHVKGDKIDIHRLEENIKLLSTTSPSTLILASIDIGRRILALYGEEILNRLLSFIEKFTYKLKEANSNLSIYPNADKTKLLFYGLDGEELSRILWKDYRIQAEFFSTTYCLFIISLLDSEETIYRLYDTLKCIEVSPPKIFSKIPRYDLGILPSDAYFSSKERKKTIDAVGRISGEVITQYPPGVPIVVPGAIITPDIRDYLISIGKSDIDVTLH